jgi:hypothetical protein
MRFLKEPTEKTVFAFEEVAFKALASVWSKDTEDLDSSHRVY